MSVQPVGGVLDVMRCLAVLISLAGLQPDGALAAKGCQRDAEAAVPGRFVQR